MSDLIAPHGGSLKNLYVSSTEREALLESLLNCPRLTLSARQLCDYELLANGAFSPLSGFLNEEDYESVVSDSKLNDGTIWPMPITLDVAEDFASQRKRGDVIALADNEGVPLGLLTIETIYRPDRKREAKEVFGTKDVTHPGVYHLLEQTQPVYIGGSIQALDQPTHPDFKHIRLGPAEVRERFEKRGWRKTLAFQTRNPMHQAHIALAKMAARKAEANLLIQPVVGLTKPGDVDHFTRVRCYEIALRKFPEQTTMLSLLPLAMRMAGPREALWHALIRKNYGCSHFVVGRDHAGPGPGADGKPFYGPYDAQELLRSVKDDIGIEVVTVENMLYSRDRAQFVEESQVTKDETVLNLSGSEFRRRLREGLDIPEWFSYPEVVEELRERFPARSKQGLTIFFTGLSGAGKSTIAQALMVKLMEMGGRRVTLLDGDLVRQNLSSELGFSKEHRDLNILRIGYVASEITKHGGIAICAPIAPYASTRKQVRDMISEQGGFIEVHVATSLAICEERDRKGLYAKARAGIIKEFTGISDPYEAPVEPELAVDTADVSPDQAAHRVLVKLESLGYLV